MLTKVPTVHPREETQPQFANSRVHIQTVSVSQLEYTWINVCACSEFTLLTTCKTYNDRRGGRTTQRGQHVAVLERPSPPATTPTTTTTTLDRHRSLGEAAWLSREGATSDLFVNSPDQVCDEMWAAWPDKVASALQNKNVMLYNVVTSVGNGFLTLHQAIKVNQLCVHGNHAFPCVLLFFICHILIGPLTLEETSP